MLTITKEFREYPAAHRQHAHRGHCRLIHGHSWTFRLEFTAQELDENFFVVDFGRLKFLREFFENNFDHTLLLNQDDPLLESLKADLHDSASITVVPNCGAEGLAVWVFTNVTILMGMVNDPYIQDRMTLGKLKLVSVTVFEDSNNSATYSHP